MLDLDRLTIASFAAGLRRGDFSVRDVATAYLERICQRDPEINAYLEVFADVREQAAAADRELTAGRDRGILHGVPLAIKDNILISGRRVSAASRLLENYVAPYDATVIARLRAAGAIFLGRTNMDEFAMGSSTEHSAFGPTRHPRDRARVPGGSSGGSAAAVAAGLALAALGSDTGGSIRQPASFCGVVGVKPTYGRVSRSGLFALASSLDQIGPIAKTAVDAKIILDAIAGPDDLDATTVKFAPAPTSASKQKFVLGVPENFLAKGLAPAVEKNFRASLAIFRDRGDEIKTVDLPALPYALPCYYIILPAEASANLARYDGLRYGRSVTAETLLETYRRARGEGLGREVRRRIILGTYVLSAGYYDAYYRHARRVKQWLIEELTQAFHSVDALILPTTPGTAFRLGEKTDDPVAMYLEDVLTVPANIAGLPALSLPNGVDGDNLPTGLQIIAPAGGEELLFSLAERYDAVV